ncbi:hypothetical protein [Nocardioides mesophilus]|uniref:Uncharacterized protein n=1 Tax=Nocardioides mesophilus TaxID=433659 RepID=A0A7G9RFT4_9ACTN|nr:hypothetical protein [Nocardioides mesophilus]QNN54459.1 hypothetical protein H9L09_09170 [Nocardioides mesophilus]
MPKSKKSGTTVADRASELASDLAERIAPSVEMAREKTAPLIAEAREKAGPVIADARDKATPVVQDARTRFTTEVLPALTAAVAAANEATEDVREETAKRGKAAVAALRGEVEAPKQTHRLRNLLVVLGLGGVVAFVAKKMSSRPATTTWQSPTPPTPPSATNTGTHRAEDSTVAAGEGEQGNDTGGASPDVVAADAATEPHTATTPDNPAETIDIKRD